MDTNLNTQNTEKISETKPRSENEDIKEEEPKEDQFEVQAWIYPGEPSCNAKSEISDGRKIDTLKPEYFEVSETGNINLLTEDIAGCNGFSEQNLQLVKQYSLKQFITVSSDISSMRTLFSKETNFENGIKTLTGFARKYDITGIEIDFEDFSAWTKLDYENYIKFAKQLKEKLAQDNKLLILDGPPITKEDQRLFQWNYKDFEDETYADFIVIMAYDYQYDHGVGESIAPNSWVKATYEYALNLVGDNNKIVVGIPSYGYTGNTGEFKAQILTKEQIQKKIGEQNKAILNNDSFEMQISIGDQFYSYYDKSGLEQKINFIRTFGAQKISIWHLGGNDWF